MTRRQLVGGTAAAVAVSLSGACGAARRTVRRRPELPFGVQSGDPTPSSAMIWSACDRPARMIVEWSTDPAFGTVHRVAGPRAEPATGLTACCEIGGLPTGAEIHYRVVFEDGTALSAPTVGRLRTAPSSNDRRDVTLAWSGDVCGQGWGINPEWGGLRTFATLRALAPDLFIHSGDEIYADDPLRPEVHTPDGRVWKNLVTPAKEKVAETLDELRGQYTYNLLDEHLRGFLAEVPVVAQWDDHEVVNNWNPGKRLDGRYRERDVMALSRRARQAFLEHNAIRPGPIHRRVAYGPSLDLFVLDARSFRTANSANDQLVPGPATAMLGPQQLAWLIGALSGSAATWKIVCSDVPIGLIIGDGPAAFEGFAQGDGPPLGREHELATLLGALEDRWTRNVVFITADVHYAAAHRFDPARARATRFAPFWEFVAGPLHAGSFGPNLLDPTFGPEVVFVRAPPPGQANVPPWGGLQSYGVLRVDGRSQTLEVALHDGLGALLWKKVLEPDRR